jgi:hypothetical protein
MHTLFHFGAKVLKAHFVLLDFNLLGQQAKTVTEATIMHII